jgi:ABC-type transporter Mla MlaB component
MNGLGWSTRSTSHEISDHCCLDTREVGPNLFICTGLVRLETQREIWRGDCLNRVQNYMALRISKGNTSDHTLTLSLEGSVMGPWVAVLQTACEEALSNGDQLTLDLGRVSFIDSAGIVVLRTYMDRAIELVNCSRFTSMQLQGNADAMHDGPGPK